MATVKLVSSQNHYLPRYFPHHPLLVHPASSPQQTMTLDYSLPQRSASTDYDPGSSDSTREMSSPPSPEDRDALGLAETPTKRNKRKLSEPKKRADLCLKKPHPSSPIRKDSSLDNDQGSKKGKKLANGHCKISSISTSKKLSARTSSTDIKRDTSSSSSSLSNIDSDSSKENPLASLTNVVPHFISPMFSGVQPQAFGYVPGIYLAGRGFSRPGIHAPFPALPLNLQHNYITAAAAAAAAAVSHSSSSPPSSTAAATSSLYSLAVARLASSKTEHSVSELHPKHQPPLQSTVNPPIPSSISSSVPPPSPFSALHLPSSSHHHHHHPNSSRTINDDDEALSSRAQSPEDLSLGGRLSRKHRKNYKNMTRERRVEANARERTRVHTISAAFDALRRAVPSYSHNQKLSKLAILRIASSYILALARLTDQDYSSATDHIRKPLTFAECVDMCTSTIQTEGRARRRH